MHCDRAGKLVAQPLANSYAPPVTPAANPASAPNAYRDRKRHAWLMSLLVPCAVAIGPALMVATGDARALWAPVVLFYGVFPVLDWLLGEDLSNPPESAVPALDADPYYRRITYALVPVLWAGFIFSAWFVARHDLPWHGLLAMVLITGSVGGFCINLGHEVGHKNTPLERWLAKIILAPTAYGHFTVEHNRGHHRDVATPVDPASSRMGESIYRFVLREMPGALVRAWGLERDRLGRTGKGVWSLQNEILQPALITLALWAALAIWLGPSASARCICGALPGWRRAAERCQNPNMRPSQALFSKRADVLALAIACGASGVRVFGSAASGQDSEGSDLDLLVDLPVGTSLLRIVGLQQGIEDALGVKVDLCTERELHPELRQRVLAQARPL